MQVLGRHPALESLKMSSCPKISDTCLAALPASTLRELTLVCCNGIVGRLTGSPEAIGATRGHFMQQRDRRCSTGKC